MRMKTALSLLYIVLSMIGIADAGYITVNEYLIPGREVVCGPGFDCSSVLDSPYAHIGPFPLAVLGLVFYSTVFILGVLNFLEVDVRPFFNRLANKLKLNKLSPIRFITTHELLVFLTIFGALFSLYLLIVMGYILRAWCQFCLISAGTSMSLFLITILYTTLVQNRSLFVLKNLNFKIFSFLYKNLLKPMLFLFDAEKVHNSFTSFGEVLGNFGLTQKITHASFAFKHPTTAKKIDGITFPNRIGLSAGFDYNASLTGILPDVGFGWHTIGTITYEPYAGNPTPRLKRLPESKGLLVNKGLKNIGARGIIKKLEGRKFRIPTGVSIASTNKLFKNTKEQIVDILMSFKLFEESRVDLSYYELNISCPNTFGGEPFTTPGRLKLLLTALDKLDITKPLYVKMPIDQSEEDTLQLLKVLDKYNIQGVILGNLTKNKNNPAVSKTERKIWREGKGNVSGKATWELSNNLIKLTKKKYKKRFTIIGTGGIFTAADADKKLKLGADLVQLITGMVFEGPQLLGEISHLQARKKLAN